MKNNSTRRSICGLHGSLGRGSEPHEPHVNPTTMMWQKGLSTIRKPVITDHSLNLEGISL